MAALAIMIFVALFAFSADAFGWGAYETDVRIAMVLCFVLGIICGMRTKG